MFSSVMKPPRTMGTFITVFNEETLRGDFVLMAFNKETKKNPLKKFKFFGSLLKNATLFSYLKNQEDVF